MNPARPHGPVAPETALVRIFSVARRGRRSPCRRGFEPAGLPLAGRRWPLGAFVLFLAAAPFAAAAEPATPVDDSPAFTTVNLALGLAGLGTLCGIAGIVVAVRATKRAHHAAQEAGDARARATQGGGSAEELARAERMWTSKFAALEAQLQNGRGSHAGTANGQTRSPFGRDAAATGDATLRISELEKTVAGLGVQVQQLQQQQRRPVATTRVAEPEWPPCLTADTTAMQDVRSALGQALKAEEPAAKDVLDKLRAAEGWGKTRPGTGELATELVAISSLLLIALRKGASVAPLDGALLCDRVLAAVRPLWKPIHPEVDCRSFYPGATFDPDWMEDHTRAGLRRPVISEMLSPAVFEKTDTSRRLLAKARVTAD